MSPCGRMHPPPQWLAPAPRSRGRGFRLRSRLRLPCDSVGCGARRSPGSASSANDLFAAGARLRSEANGGGVALAASIRARIEGVRRGPSATRPPTTAAVARVRRADSTPSAPPISASAIASFIPAR
eukprot:4506378-Pleurochrysis_carterae.AAC.1